MRSTSGWFYREYQEQKTAFKACLTPYCLVNGSLLCDFCVVGQHSIPQLTKPTQMRTRPGGGTFPGPNCGSSRGTEQ